MSRRRIVLAATAALAIAAPSALAAADQSFELTATAPTAKWEGAAQVTRGAPVYDETSRTALGCDTPARPCDDVLLKVTEAGKLAIKVEGAAAAAGTTDVDLYVYKSDAEGTEGEKLATAANSGPDATSVKVTPGYYLARVDYYNAYGAGYAGSATLSGFAAPVAPVTAAPVAPPPAPAAPASTTTTKKPSKRAACIKKAKKIKNKRKRAKAVKRCKTRRS